MKAPFFPNQTIEIFNLKDDVRYDDYGKIIEYELTETIKADVQPQTPDDSQKEFGEILQDTFKMYTAANASIYDTSIIRIKNVPGTYKIIGSPENNNHLLQHLKVFLQRERKDTILP